MKYKKLSEEDDLTLFREYECLQGFISYKSMIFYIFLLVLYYSGYARWFFWTLLILYLLCFIAYLFDGVPSYLNILKKELKRRGYKK